MSGTIGERLDALKQPSPKVDSYGEHACGCTWDSGPYGVYCEKHDGERLERDALRELHSAAADALGNASRDNLAHLKDVVADVGRLLTEGTQPPT